MADNGEILQDDCAEVLVKTEIDGEPRGETVEELSSFEKLVHTALALEKDPLTEHDYAISNMVYLMKDHSYSSVSLDPKRRAYRDMREGTCLGKTDHCYFHRHTDDDVLKDQSSSAENISSQDGYKNCTPLLSGKLADNTSLLKQYRSADSALDVTGFDMVSDKCLSEESIDLRTVDVFTEQQMFSGISDPDISKMSIESESTTLSSSLPENPFSVGKSLDHTYSNSISGCIETNRDHTYNSSDKVSTRRDSLPTAVGVKRGLSNEDLSLTNLLYFKRQDFKKSPFLDQSYPLLEKKNFNECAQKNRKRETTRKMDIQNVYKIAQEIGFKSYATYSESNQTLLDHTYEEINDTANCFKVSDLMRRMNRDDCKSSIFTSSEDINGSTNDKTDHSYVMPKDEDSVIDMYTSSSSALSDSGTESLNEEEEVEMSLTFERLMTNMATKKDHTYV